MANESGTDAVAREALEGLREGIFQELKDKRSLVFWSGVLMTVAGALSLVFPLAGTLTVNYFVGFMMLFAGVAGIFTSFSLSGTGPFFGALLWGLLSTVAGVYLVTHPEIGAVILTITVAVLFMFQGAYEIYLAILLRKEGNWVWMLISGIFSILMTWLIASDLAVASAVVLGIIMGINFLTSGIAYLFLANEIKKREQA